MKKVALALFVLCFWAHPALAEPPTADQLIAQSNKQADAKQYDLALQSLKEAAAIEPDNMDVKLQVIRVHAWQGHYDQARSELNALMKSNPDNADMRTLAATIDYYQGHYASAAAQFSKILVTYPNFAEAADGLKLAQDGEKTNEGFVWQFDVGYEHSSFARQSQTPWNDEFAQLTHFFDGGATALHGRLEHFSEFETGNTYAELGVDHQFEPYLNGFFYAGHTFDATFRPAWRVGTGGAVRLDTPQEDQPTPWFTLDIKEDEYKNVSIATIDPGARIEWGQWILSPNLVIVEPWSSTPLFGWNTRLDGPLYNKLRFYAGYTDAPETENAIIVYTTSIYGGLSYAIDDAHTATLDYTRDDRQHSWIRHAVDIALSSKF